jgi:hypothetical protein
MVAHAAAVAIGRAGGLAGKGSPARHRAAIFAAAQRWKDHVKK